MSQESQCVGEVMFLVWIGRDNNKQKFKIKGYQLTVLLKSNYITLQ